MKLLLLSDIHGSYRLLSCCYELLRSNQGIKGVLFAGDFVDMGEPASFADEVAWLVDETKTRFLWVPGNNDFGRAYHRLNARHKTLEGKIIEFGVRKFTGVGGSPASWAGQYQGEKSIDKKAIAGTIFVSHVPPPGINSFQKYDQAGIVPAPSPKLSDAPLVHICSHVHHTWGVGYLGNTKVVKLAGAYLGYYAIMDLQTLSVKFGRFWK